MHPTYKHLEDRIRLASLTIAQWAQLAACALLAYGLAKTLPLPGSWPISMAISIAGLPAAVSIALLQEDFDVRLLRQVSGGWRGPVLYLPEGAAPPEGTARDRDGWTPGDWAALWD